MRFGYRPDMTWQYLAVDGKDLAYPDNLSLGEAISQGLTRWGDEGWELVAVQGVDEATTLYIFKRQRP